MNHRRAKLQILPRSRFLETRKHKLIITLYYCVVYFLGLLEFARRPGASVLFDHVGFGNYLIIGGFC